MGANTILYLIKHEGINTNTRLAGIRRAATVIGAQVEKVLWPADDSFDICRLIDFWKADACLVECAGSEFIPNPRKFGRTPVVFIDCDPQHLPDSASCIFCAGEATARLAARTLLQTGATTFVYVRPRADFYWSRSREECFKSALKLNGHELVCLESSRTDAFNLDSIQRLAAVFAKLARPIGVFAANDFSGKAVIDAAKLAQLEIPGDLYVIGVDDNADICTHTEPPLSSIRLDFERSGEQAFRMANQLIHAHKRLVLRETYDALGLVPRESCQVLRCGDYRVLKGLNYIRTHLADSLNVADVVHAMGCSRRTAEERFRALQHNSILGEIRKMRLEQIQLIRSLRKDVSLDELARQVGYANRSSPWKLLHGTAPNRPTSRG